MSDLRKAATIKNPKTDVRYLDEKDTAKRLSMSVKWLQKRRQNRQPPEYFKFGNRIRYSVAELEEFEARSRYGSTSEYER